MAGVARQPVLATARLLAEAALLAGLDVSLSECPSPAAWGGPISVHVRLGDEVHSPLVREREADVLVGFEQLEALRAAHLLAPHGFAAVNELLLPTWRMRAGLDPAPDVMARLMAVTPRVVVVPANPLIPRIVERRDNFVWRVRGEPALPPPRGLQIWKSSARGCGLAGAGPAIEDSRSHFGCGTRRAESPVWTRTLGGAPHIGLVLLGVVSALLPVPEHAYQAVLAAPGAADIEARRDALRRGRELFAIHDPA